MEKHLFETEEIILRTKDNAIILTNRRIRKAVGQDHLLSIHLEKISSIEIEHKSWPLLLTAGILSCLAGVASGLKNENVLFPGLLVGVIFIIIYFATRHHTITIVSDGGSKMDILTKDMNRETILDFVNKIEQGKYLINKQS